MGSAGLIWLLFISVNVLIASVRIEILKKHFSWAWYGLWMCQNVLFLLFLSNDQTNNNSSIALHVTSWLLSCLRLVDKTAAVHHVYLLLWLRSLERNESKATVIDWKFKYSIDINQCATLHLQWIFSMSKQIFYFVPSAFVPVACRSVQNLNCFNTFGYYHMFQT